MDVAREIPKTVFNIQSQGMVKFLNDKSKALPRLYQHQVEAVIAARHQLDDPRQPIALVVLPTGCGKTGVAVLAAYALNATRVLVITPSVKISQQIYDAFCGTPCFLKERSIIFAKDENNVRPRGCCITKSNEIREHMRDDLMVVNAHKIGGTSKVEIKDIPENNYDLVIVDEAHHYPAPTWKLLVDHFQGSKRLFLTATPLYRGKPILSCSPCFDLNRIDAVKRGIIRNVRFFEPSGPVRFDEHQLPAATESNRGLFEAMGAVAKLVISHLDQHDAEDPTTKHQAMVLAQTTKTLNSAETFQWAYREVAGERDRCEMYVAGSSPDILKEFQCGEIRTMVIVGRLIEGFDRKQISVVGIVRNVARSSKVLFHQFVGRAVRKVHRDDPITAVIVSHPMFDQRPNFEQFDQVTDVDNEDEED